MSLLVQKMLGNFLLLSESVSMATKKIPFLRLPLGKQSEWDLDQIWVRVTIGYPYYPQKKFKLQKQDFFYRRQVILQHFKITGSINNITIISLVIRKHCK